MKFKIHPEIRFLFIPTVYGLELMDYLQDQDYTVDSKGWLRHISNPPRVRIGDMLALIQEHPDLTNKSTHSTISGYLTSGEDEEYIYKLEVIQK